jgi:hypothetical protein
MALECVINHTKDNYNEENYDIGKRSIRLTFDDNKTWDFFENGTWIQKGDIESNTNQGKWVCDGLQNYKITNTLGEVFSSKTKKWSATSKTDPNFYCVANSDRKLNSPEKIIRGANSYTRIFKAEDHGADHTWIFNKDKSWIGRFEEDTPSETYTLKGTWKCNGNDSYEILTNSKFFPKKWHPEKNAWTGPDEIFDCVRRWCFYNDKPFTFSSDKLIRKTSWGTRYFYKSKQFVDMKTVNGKPVVDDSGTWECDGKEANFKLRSKKSGVYSSKTNEWVEVPTTPEQTEKPTYDKSKFPLKLDSRGPEVVQLQNYLNKLIPMDPLVVNGIFDKKTQDKLIQLQKNLNLTK